LHYEANELEPARRHVLRGLELGQQMGPSSGLVSGLVVLAHLQQAMGEERKALATVGELEQLASQLALPHVEARVAATGALVRLRRGESAAVERWARSAGLSPTDPPDPLHEAAHLTYARLLLAQNRLAEVQVLLDRYERFAREGERYRSLITVCILKAQAWHALGQDEQAGACLVEALRLAAPEGYMRAFLDEGQPVLDLLLPLCHAAPVFVDALLAAAGTERKRTPGSPPHPGDRLQPLVEPLSDRELEVLRLVADGLSNRQIAERLVITVGTVKSHIHNLCGKLVVHHTGFDKVAF
jgi:LuxR family maltose regulon positive regulatory protein